MCVCNFRDFKCENVLISDDEKTVKITGILFCLCRIKTNSNKIYSPYIADRH